MSNVLYKVSVTMAVLISFCAMALAARAEEKPLAALIVGDGDIEGYKTVGRPRRFRPESLWNYINGGALPYLDYGVGDVVTWSGSMPPDDTEIVVDIYDMGSPLNAFGIYSSERFPEYDFVELGDEGYISESGAFFRKGRYYVKIFAAETEPATPSPYRILAEEVARRIPESGGMPAMFGAFPEKNRTPHTEAYIAKNVLGQDYLTGGYIVSYADGVEEYQLAVIEAPDEGTAAEWLVKYRAFIGEYGALSDTSPDVGDASFAGKEDWYGLVLFARKGRYLAGSVGLDDRSAAIDIVRGLVTTAGVADE